MTRKVVQYKADDNLPVKTEFLLFKTEDGRVSIETRMQDETVWLTPSYPH